MESNQYESLHTILTVKLLSVTDAALTELKTIINCYTSIIGHKSHLTNRLFPRNLKLHNCLDKDRNMTKIHIYMYIYIYIS